VKTIGVVVPVYREEEGIELFHARLWAALSPLGERYGFQIIYVVDKSPDATETKLRRIAAVSNSVVVLVLSRRFGHQAALVAGIDRCRTDAVIMLDGDLQHPPELLPAMLERFEAGADIVQMIRRDAISGGVVKHLFSGLFYRLFGRLAPMRIPPGSADFRLLSRRVAEVFRAQLREQNPFLRGLVFWVGFNIVYVSFEGQSRQHGTTKYGLGRLLGFAVNGLCSFSKVPLRTCTMFGIALAGFSLVLGGGQVLAYLLSAHNVPGWASIMTSLCFVTGVQLFFIGILGEYIGLIFDEVKRRPLYLVERVYPAQSGGEPSVELESATRRGVTGHRSDG
jgi:polyisoprenyl-phosphate glycosyltransferase